MAAVLNPSVDITPPVGGARILIHYTALNRGGAENSLLRFMAGMVKRGCEVHLVLTVPGGELESAVDPRVVVHHLRRRAAGTSNIPGRVLGWFEQRWAEREFRSMGFDAAFVGRAGMSHDFVCRAVNARKRLVFVRNDPAVDVSGRWERQISRFGDQIDHYVCVSRFVQQAMEQRFPSIREKLVTIYNLIDPERMLANASSLADPLGPPADVPRILSVCRLHERQKALVRMVQAHKRLLERGILHEWYVLGDGPDRGLLEAEIEALSVDKTFKLLGSVANPFPYYRGADVVAILSRYEGLCGVVNEARVLERPVVATRFSAIDEQIASGVNGLIVEQDLDSIVAGLETLLGDSVLRERLARGGYPGELLDDEAKLDKVIYLVSRIDRSGSA